MPWLGVSKSLCGPDNAATMERVPCRKPGPQLVKLRELVENNEGTRKGRPYGVGEFFSGLRTPMT